MSTQPGRGDKRWILSKVMHLGGGLPNERVSDSAPWRYLINHFEDVV